MTNERAWDLALLVATLTHEFTRMKPKPSDYAPGVAADAVQLAKLGVELHAMAEVACNRGLKSYEERKVARLENEVRQIATRYGLEVKFNGDPRGYPVKLTGLHSSNSWDGTYGVG